MKNVLFRGLAAALMLLVSPMVCAQEAAPVSAAPASAMTVSNGPSPTVLRAGTPVVLRLMTNLTTNGKHLKVGDRFSLEVSEPVTLNGQVVIQAGSPAVGEVTSVRNKGMWGKSGNIETRLLYISANDRRIRLTGSVGDKGVKVGGGAIVVSAIVFLPAGFFMTGTSAVIPPGTVVNGILDEDIPVVFATAPGHAMSVPASVPTSAPVSTGSVTPAAVIPVSAKTIH